MVFGLFVIFDSLGRVQNALELRRCQYSSWKGFLLLALLSVVLGIVMVVNPFGAMETLVMAIGVILIVEGALNLLSAAYTAFAVRRFMKMHPEAQSVLEAVTGQDLNGDGVVAPNVTPADARQKPWSWIRWTRAPRWRPTGRGNVPGCGLYRLRIKVKEQR